MKLYGKIFFVTAGLAIIAAGFFFSKSHIVEAALKSGQKFGDWTVACNKDDKKQEICFLVQQFTTTKDDKTQVLAVYQIGYFGKEKALKMIQIVPLGVRLEPGTSIISVDNKLIAPGKFGICDAAGCQAVANISDEDLKTITSNSPNSLGIIGGDGKQANFPISNNGLKEGLEALSKR
jgi:invasion protein IalB